MSTIKDSSKTLSRHSVRGKFFVFGVAVSACWQSAASRAVALRDTPKKRIFPGQNIRMSAFVVRIAISGLDVRKWQP